MIAKLLIHHIKRSFRQPGQLVYLLAFYLLITMLYPFARGGGIATLIADAPAVIWMAVLFVSSLSIQHIFTEDFQSGALHQQRLLPISPAALVFTQILHHWLTVMLLLLALTPIIAMLYYVTPGHMQDLLVGLLVGTPAISAICVLSATLTLGLRRHNLVASLVAMPLYIPILIFASASSQQTDSMLYLMGMGLVILPMSVLFGSLALTIAVED